MTSLQKPAEADDRIAAKQGRVSPLVTMAAAAALVVLTVCAAGTTVWKMHGQVDRETRANLGKLALVIADQTSRSFQGVDLVLTDLVAYLATNGPDTADGLRDGMSGASAHEFLVDRARNLSQVSNLILVDADGWLINQSRNQPTPRISILDREQFRHLRDNNDGALFVSEPVRNMVDGTWTIYLARRINGPQGTFLGVMEAAIRLQHFEAFYQTIAPGEGGSIALLRRDGVLLARYPAVESMIGRSLGSQSMFQTIDKYIDRGGILKVGLVDGVSRYVAFGTVRGFPLVVSTSLKEEVVLGAWRRDALMLLVGALGALAGVVVLLLALARQIRCMRRSEDLLALQNLELERGSKQLLEAQRIGKFGHFTSDLTTQRTVFSRELIEISGLPPVASFSLDEVRSLYHTDDVEGIWRARSTSISLGTTMVHEFRWIRPDGQLLWVHLEADPVFDSDGQVVGLFGIIQDITSAKLAEALLDQRVADLELARNHLEAQKRELAKINQQFDAALSNMSQGLCLFDADRNLVISNKRFREIYNLTEDQTRPGISLVNLLQFQVANGEKTDRTLDEEVEEIPTQRNQIFRLVDGRTIMIQRTPIPGGGWVATHEDITERERAATVLAQRLAELELTRSRLEAQQRELIATTADLRAARDVAETASRAKSDFLAMMSHEVRTPMTGMMGMIGLLYGTPLDKEQQLLADAARESAGDLLVVVNNILDFSKLEAGKLTAESIGFNIERLIDGVALLLGAELRGDLSLQVSVSDDMPAWLNGDPNRIRQILLNLTSNAIKFTARGTVSLTAAYRALAGDLVELRIEVIDSGIGISRDVQDRLFTPFTQADTSVSRRYGGTGLGLAICRQLCMTMGGTIGVESAPGEGSTFWFTVQCERAEAPIVPAPPLQPAIEHSGRPLSILVAEDNPMIQGLISKLLSKQGHQADLVCNGKEAVDAVQCKSYDLVLMDMQMPEMDGITATRTIRGLPGPERHVPIVALTGNALVGQREAYLAAGMNDYLSKPIEPADFYAAIDRWGTASKLSKQTSGPRSPVANEAPTDAL